MKSIEVIVPRNIIKKFYPHPELYGDFIVELINGMTTDVYYREEGHFVTITSEEELIDYLSKQPLTPVDYRYRNGIFSLRKITNDDKQLLYNWKAKDLFSRFIKIPRKAIRSSILKEFHVEMIVSFYWIEVGIVQIQIDKSTVIVKLTIYQHLLKNRVEDQYLVTQLDVDTVLSLLEEHFTK